MTRLLLEKTKQKLNDAASFGEKKKLMTRLLDAFITGNPFFRDKFTWKLVYGGILEL